MNYLYILVILLAATDFIVAFYIFSHKSKSTTLTCPLHGNCEAVVHSKYGKTFGIENSILGMLYNMAMVLGVLLSSYSSISIIGFPLYFWLMLVAIGGAIFSLYLMFVMVVKIKERCTWCVISAVIAVTIATLLVINYLLIK